MIDSIRKHINTSDNQSFDFSIIIPTWNNLAYLKLCIKSILQNSSCTIQIIVFVNEGKDGTIEWLNEQQDIDYIISPENLGICYALNYSASLIKADYLIYMNDDMYVLPKWDTIIQDELKALKTKHFMLSATMIEPFESGNSCVIVKNYGTAIENFKEEKLLKDTKDIERDDWHGSSWPPIIVHKDMWYAVGGFSVEFSPGMYSDPDFSMKLYQSGVRIFKGLGQSLIYHFGSKTTHRVPKNNASKNLFLLKWNISARAFYRKKLHLGKPYSRKYTEGELSFLDNFILRLKRKWKS